MHFPSIPAPSIAVTFNKLLFKHVRDARKPFNFLTHYSHHSSAQPIWGSQSQSMSFSDVCVLLASPGVTSGTAVMAQMSLPAPCTQPPAAAHGADGAARGFGSSWLPKERRSTPSSQLVWLSCSPGSRDFALGGIRVRELGGPGPIARALYSHKALHSLRLPDQKKKSFLRAQLKDRSQYPSDFG